MGVLGVVEEWFFTGGVEFPALGRGADKGVSAIVIANNRVNAC